MQWNRCFVTLGLILLAAWPLQAEVIKGVMAVKGAEMNWWGGVARDAIARQYDVDKNSVQLTLEPDAKGSYQPGTIAFRAKQGKSIDVAKIHESIKATRLSGGTKMQVTYLEITATGDVAMGDKDDLVLKVSGTGQRFTLGDEPDAKRDGGGKTPCQRLREAVARGEKAASVTGRVQGWTGVFPKVLSELPGEPVQQPDRPEARRMKLMVTDLQMAEK